MYTMSSLGRSFSTSPMITARLSAMSLPKLMRTCQTDFTATSHLSRCCAPTVSLVLPPSSCVPLNVTCGRPSKLGTFLCTCGALTTLLSTSTTTPLVTRLMTSRQAITLMVRTRMTCAKPSRTRPPPLTRTRVYLLLLRKWPSCSTVMKRKSPRTPSQLMAPWPKVTLSTISMTTKQQQNNLLFSSNHNLTTLYSLPTFYSFFILKFEHPWIFLCATSIRVTIRITLPIPFTLFMVPLLIILQLCAIALIIFIVLLQLPLLLLSNIVIFPYRYASFPMIIICSLLSLIEKLIPLVVLLLRR